MKVTLRHEKGGRDWGQVGTFSSMGQEFLREILNWNPIRNNQIIRITTCIIRHFPCYFGHILFCDKSLFIQKKKKVYFITTLQQRVKTECEIHIIYIYIYLFIYISTFYEPSLVTTVSDANIEQWSFNWLFNNMKCPFIYRKMEMLV